MVLPDFHSLAFLGQPLRLSEPPFEDICSNTYLGSPQLRNFGNYVGVPLPSPSRPEINPDPIFGDFI